VHREIADLKGRLGLIQQATEQSRALAADAIDRANALRARIDESEDQAPHLMHLQDELRVVREQLARVYEDVNSLRQSREEVERRLLYDAERGRHDKNDSVRHFAELERLIEGWQERVSGFEEHNRRNLEAVAQVQIKLEALATEQGEAELRQSRVQPMISRLDQDLVRLSSLLPGLQRDDDVHKERANSLTEMVHRLEDQIDVLRTQLGRIDRTEDSIELLRAERSRHGERILEMTLELDALKEASAQQSERLSLLDVRLQSFQDEVRALGAKLSDFRDEFVAYLRGLSDMEADFRKRQLNAIEKEMRDIRSRGVSLGEE
jgi:chromosome segregation ATPase